MTKRLFDVDREAGTVEWFHYDDENDTFTIELAQDIEGIVEGNKAAFNEYSSGRDAWGDGIGERTRVARIPLTILHDWFQTGQWRDQAFLRRWLNDPANAVFRTRPGVV